MRTITEDIRVRLTPVKRSLFQINDLQTVPNRTSEEMAIKKRDVPVLINASHQIGHLNKHSRVESKCGMKAAYLKVSLHYTEVNSCACNQISRQKCICN